MIKKLFLGSECELFVNGSGNRTYICLSRGEVNGHSICATGEASTLDEAELKAREKLDVVCSELEEAESTHFDYKYNASFNISAQSSAKDYLKGGGNKKASERQIDKIRELAKAHDTTAKDIVYEKYGKQLDQLIGCEADAIIKYLVKMEQKDEFF